MLHVSILRINILDFLRICTKFFGCTKAFTCEETKISKIILYACLKLHWYLQRFAIKTNRVLAEFWKKDWWYNFFMHTFFHQQNKLSWVLWLSRICEYMLWKNQTCKIHCKFENIKNFNLPYFCQTLLPAILVPNVNSYFHYPEIQFFKTVFHACITEALVAE